MEEGFMLVVTFLGSQSPLPLKPAESSAISETKPVNRVSLSL